MGEDYEKLLWRVLKDPERFFKETYEELKRKNPSLFDKFTEIVLSGVGMYIGLVDSCVLPVGFLFKKVAEPILVLIKFMGGTELSVPLNEVMMQNVRDKIIKLIKRKKVETFLEELKNKGEEEILNLINLLTNADPYFLVKRSMVEQKIIRLSLIFTYLVIKEQKEAQNFKEKMERMCSITEA